MTSIKPVTPGAQPLPAGEPNVPTTASPQAPPSASPDAFDPSSPTIDALAAPVPSDAELAKAEKDLTAGADAVAELFPQEMRAGVKEALEISIGRVRSAKAAGTIDETEAGVALEMMRELFEGLGDLRSGRAKVTIKPNNNDGVRVWRLRSADGDEFQVTARRRLDEFGEARIGFRQVLDDGRPLPGRHRVSLRVDLERFGHASVDMQYGGSSLDKRIHGLMKNEDGTVFETASGKNLADHHFRDTLPDHIEDPEVFAELVARFSTGVMQPLEVAP